MSTEFTNKKLIFILFYFSVTILTISFYNLSNLKSLKFNWDETDYVNASIKGFYENYTDNESLSIKQFIYIGKEKYFNRDLESNIIKNFVNEENDNYHLRHYHPPLPVYYWSFFISEKDSINEINKKLRYSLMILYLFFIFSMLLAIYNTLQINYSRIFLTLVIICAFVTNKVVINGFINLQFHIFYALALTYHLYSLINMYMKKNSIFNSCNFIFSTSLLIITLHTSLISIFATLISIIYLNRISEKKITIISIIKYLFLSLLLTVILFPPMITKLYYGKIFLTYVYKLVLLKGNEFSMYGSLLDKWYNFFYNNNYIFILPLICIFLSIINYKKENRYLNIFIIHGVCYSIFISPFFVSFNYILPALTCILFFTISYVSLSHNLETKIQKLIVSTISLLVVIINLNLLKIDEYKNMVADYNKGLESLIGLIDKNNEKKYLIDGSHIFKMYTNNNNIDELSILSRTKSDFAIRENFKYISAESKIKKGNYNYIVIQKNRKFSNERISFLNINNYFKIEDEYYDIYQLTNKKN